VSHTLLVSHIRTVLTAACRLRPELRLFVWQEGRTIQDTVEVALADGYQKIPVAPDAFFGLEEAAKGRMYFFLEADRSSMTIKRFHLKLQAYAAYWQEKKHYEKFHIRNFRVLTVTTSRVRQANLIAAAAEDNEVAKLNRMFLFTDENQLSLSSPESILEKIWTPVVGQGPVSLLG
jgi:hypothetical protein